MIYERMFLNIDFKVYGHQFILEYIFAGFFGKIIIIEIIMFHLIYINFYVNS